MKTLEKNKMNTNTFRPALQVVVILPFLWSCTGGDSPVADNNNYTNTNNTTDKRALVFMRGTLAQGSLTVNGVTFTVAPDATILIDDHPGTEAELEHGMEVELSGRLNEDGVTGEAEFIAAESEVKGLVESIDTQANPPALVVLGQTVLVDDLTVWANVGGIGGVAVGDPVEVHGRRDALGAIRASRVELLSGDIGELEIRGTIVSLSGASFYLGSQLVDASSAIIEPQGSTLENGDFVEVKGALEGGTLVATRVQHEDGEHPEVEPGENEHLEVEGLISGFVGHPGTFQVSGSEVRTTASTRFAFGSFEDLGNDVRVEAEGHFIGGVLVADKIKFTRAMIRFITDDMSYDAVAGALTMFGKPILINDLTEIEGDAAAADRLEMRGYIDSDGNIVAVRLEDGGNSNGGRDILQAIVEAGGPSGDTLTFLTDIEASLGGSVEFYDANDAPIARAAFFDAVGVGSVVKVRGEFDAATKTLVGQEAELEN